MFSKKNLDSGNVVEIRNGQRFLYHNIDRNKILSIQGFTYLNLDDYDENLKCKIAYLNTLDIMKIYQDYTCKELLWERKEKPKLTEDEKAILRNLPKEYKWIVRDHIGSLWIFENKPNNNIFGWFYSTASTLPFPNLFKFIKYEDKEPYSIEKLLEE